MVVVHYWADLQSVHRFGCYGNIRAKCEMSARTLVLAVWLVEHYHQGYVNAVYSTGANYPERFLRNSLPSGERFVVFSQLDLFQALKQNKKETNILLYFHIILLYYSNI